MFRESFGMQRWIQVLDAIILATVSYLHSGDHPFGCKTPRECWISNEALDANSWKSITSIFIVVEDELVTRLSSVGYGSTFIPGVE